MRFILSTIAAALLATGAQATILVNGSFESGPAGSGVLTQPTGSTAITGWKVGGAGVDDVTSSVWAAAAGTHSIDLSALTAGSVSQRISGFVVGLPYRVTFLASANPFGAAGLKKFSVSATGGVAQLYSYNLTALNSPTNMLYQTYTYDFIAGATKQTLQFASQVRNPYGVVIDDVSIRAVPEPGVWALLIAGFGMTGFAMRRRRIATAS